MSALLIAIVTFFGLVFGVPIAFALLRLFGFYVTVGEREARVSAVHGRVDDDTVAREHQRCAGCVGVTRDRRPGLGGHVADRAVGAGEDADAKVTEGLRLYAKLKEHLPPSTAAKLAAELSGAPRKALYGSE